MSAPLSYTLAVIAVCALCTFGERMLPFLIFRKGEVVRSVRGQEALLAAFMEELQALLTEKGYE